MPSDNDTSTPRVDRGDTSAEGRWGHSQHEAGTVASQSVASEKSGGTRPAHRPVRKD